jgi:hypothetical protein
MNMVRRGGSVALATGGRESRIVAAIKKIMVTPGGGQNNATLAVSVENLIPMLLHDYPDLFGTMTVAEAIPAIRAAAKKAGFVGNTYTPEYVSPDRQKAAVDALSRGAGLSLTPAPMTETERLLAEGQRVLDAIDHPGGTRYDQAVRQLAHACHVDRRPPPPEPGGMALAIEIADELRGGVGRKRENEVAAEWMNNCGAMLGIDSPGAMLSDLAGQQKGLPDMLLPGRAATLGPSGLGQYAKVIERDAREWKARLGDAPFESLYRAVVRGDEDALAEWGGPDELLAQLAEWYPELSGSDVRPADDRPRRSRTAYGAPGPPPVTDAVVRKDQAYARRLGRP